MTVVGILWVVLTPYCTGLLVAWSRLANRLVTRHLRASTALGWGGVATLFAGVFAVGGHDGMVMAIASAPFVGLAVWQTRPGGGEDPAPDPEDAPPAPDAVTRRGVRLPAPARKHPSGHHGTPRRPRVRA